MTIRYTQEANISVEELAALFDSSGIRRPTGDKDRIRRMLDAADLMITAWDNDRLVGVARSLTDFSFCCYLSDLAVDHGYQHQGIGTELIKQTYEVIGKECNLYLVSAPQAMPFYEKIGLKLVTNGWMIPREL